jgi:hypothetical protein
MVVVWRGGYGADEGDKTDYCNICTWCEGNVNVYVEVAVGSNYDQVE